MHMHIDRSSIEQAEKFVTRLFETYPNASLVFHNLHHTRNVVKRAIEIASYYRLLQHDLTLLVTAAWFHDTGYLFVEHKIHEEKSVEMMMDHLKSYPVSSLDISMIAECILATKIPVAPRGLLQEILCDADTYHFGTDAFNVSNEQVFCELQQLHPDLTKRSFNLGAIRMLEGHKFHTAYCQQLLSAGKEKNILHTRKVVDLL